MDILNYRGVVVVVLIVLAQAVSVTAQEAIDDPDAWITVIPIDKIENFNPGNVHEFQNFSLETLKAQLSSNYFDDSVSTMSGANISIPLYCPIVGNISFSVGPQANGFTVFRRLTGFSSSPIPFTCPGLLGCWVVAGTQGPTVSVDVTSSNGAVLLNAWCSNR